MSALILPSRRVVQPQGALAANISSPLARDMRFLWAHGSDRDLVKGAPYAIAGTAPADTSTTKGFAKVGAGSGNLNFGLRTDLGTPGTNQLSVMAVAYIDNSAAAVGAFMGRVNGAFCFTLSVNGGAQQFTFGINQGSTVAVPAISVAGGLLPTNKRPVVIVGTYNGATADLYVETFGDSAFKGSNSSARTGNFPSNPSDPFSLLSRGGTGERLNGASMLAGGVWGRALHRNEVDAILENPWQLFRPIQRRIIVSVAGAPSPITGTLAATLANLNASAAGGVRVTGQASPALAAMTAAGAGQAIIAGTSAKTLDAATVAASGTVGSTAANGSASITLSAATLAGAGAVQATGTASVNLAGMTAAGAGAVRATGAASNTLDTMTAAAVGTVRASGSAARALADASLSAAGGVRVTGAASNTLAPATLVATGVLPVAGAANGSLNATLAAAAVSASGTTPVAATLARTLGGATVAAAGAVRASGQAGVTMGGLHLVAAGGVLTAAGAAIVLEGMTVAGAGGTVARGNMSASLGDVALVADGYAGDGNRGQVDATLGDASLQAAGVLLFGFTPSVARTLVVPGEDRRQVVKAETRTATIEQEKRTYKVA